MSLSNRALLLAVVIGLAQFGAWAAGSWYTARPALPPEHNLDELPMELGEWRGTQAPLPRELLDEIAGASVMNRTYRNARGETVEVHSAAFTDYDIGPPHFPPSCYHGAGWKLRSAHIVPLEHGKGESANIVVYLFERDGIEALVAFWMQAGKETYIDRDGLRHLLLRARATATRLPLLKKVMLHTSVDTRQRAEQRLLEVAKAIFDKVDAFK